MFSEEVPSCADYFDLVSEAVPTLGIFEIGAIGVRLVFRFFFMIRFALLFDRAGFTADGV